MKKYLFAGMLMLLATFAYAQQLSGYIFDESQMAVEGVNIQNTSQSTHTHSNEEGYFSLEKIQPGDSLLFSHTSFKTKKIAIAKADTLLRIMLVQKRLSIKEISISPALNALTVFSDIDLRTSPVNSSQEILRKVPGLIIGQHAGGGKAEQIFLRGFDTDHGTDINITVDGLPVNMVSHAHGQGYADLHFIIPELIDEIDYGKGPYYAGKGNLTTAAYVAFKTKERLNESEIKTEIGRFGTARTLGTFNLLNTQQQSAYLASELLLSNGHFESSQNFSRINMAGRYTAHFNDNDKLSVGLSLFRSQWDASGQIPQRAVDSGLISRFGAIDDTEGGFTGRKNLNIQYNRYLNDQNWITTQIYHTTYDFELYSNFTFFLNDPVNGDQIKQKEARKISGFESIINRHYNNTMYQMAIGMRNDEINGSELSHTLHRKLILDRLSLGNVNETNIFTYLNVEFKKERWLINPSLRFDWFNFIYTNHLAESYSTESLSKTIVSPKINVLYNQSNSLQWYFKAGKGFHSNDTRVVIAQDGQSILPAAYGTDLGFIWKPLPGILLNTALWQLFMEQEFIYVGDEGVVEAGGRTSRAGLDFGFRIQLHPSVFIQNDINYAYARSIDEADGENYIPLAPDLTMTGGINYLPQGNKGFFGSLHYRMINKRPANEDYSIVAKGYTIVDFNGGYQWNRIRAGLIVNNLLNSEWNETQFATETRLANENEAVEEIHFIPGTPFSWRISLSYIF
ncbi:TonB-dependent receptor [Roseimarinus sediminis]|uniref:TonB-dependent receptor n=1 Tax=Roseimarinus sediminis TaxID=1610899 RepID=UPI003D239B22